MDILAFGPNKYSNIMLLVSICSIALTFLFVNYHLYRPLVAFLYFNHQFFLLCDKFSSTRQFLENWVCISELYAFGYHSCVQSHFTCIFLMGANIAVLDFSKNYSNQSIGMRDNLMRRGVFFLSFRYGSSKRVNLI